MRGLSAVVMAAIHRAKRRLIAVSSACALSSAAAQDSPFSAGPQMTTLGVGASASYFVMPRVSLSALSNSLEVLVTISLA